MSTTFSSLLPYILISLLIFLIVLAFIIFRNIKKNNKKVDIKSEDKDPKEQKGKYDSFVKLRISFIYALRFLKKRVAGRNYVYKLPWYLAIGESYSGKSTMLENVGFGLPINDLKSEKDDQKKGIRWWFYDNAVVIEPKGEFILGNDGVSSNETGWKNTIKLLRKYRPNCPIDGVVITIPCTDVIPEKNLWEQKNRIDEKAANLYEKLRVLQKELGICFPVYVVLTKCDAIEGFQSFTAQLSDVKKKNIFGWSNPYSLDSKYSSGWIKEAVSDILQSLFQRQMATFASQSDIKDIDSYFLFSSNIKNITELTKRYIDVIFKESAFHNSLYLRGLYLIGNDDSIDSAIKPHFTNDIFQEKIFQEPGLAKLVSQTLISKHKNLKRLQIATACVVFIGFIGLTSSYVRLNNEEQKIIPVLNEVSDSLSDLKNKSTIDRKLFEQKGIKLLSGITQIDPSTLNFIFLPSSWISSIKPKLWDSVSVAYEKIIMRMMFIELTNRVKKIGIIEKDFLNKNVYRRYEGADLESLSSFKKLLKFIKDLEELEKIILIYNEKLVNKKATSREFGQVVQFLYGIELKQSLSKDSLSKLTGTPISTKILIDNVNAKTWELTRAVFQEVFKENHLKKKIEKLVKNLNNIRKDNKRDENQTIILSIKNLLTDLEEIGESLNNPQNRWVGGFRLDLGNKFRQILESIQNSSYLGPEVYGELAKRAEREFYLLQRELKKLDTHLTGSILEQKEKQLILQFSGRVLTLVKSLKDYFSMDFSVTINENSKINSKIYKNQHLVWNVLTLERTTKLYESYNLFISEKIKSFPGDLQPVFEQVAKESLENNLVNIVSRSQSVQFIEDKLNPSARKERIRSELRNFKEVSKYLILILNIMDRLEFNKNNQNLFKLLAVQGNNTLLAINQMLSEEDIYMIQKNGFKHWQGNKSPVYSAYNVNDEEELKFYFEAQQERIKYLTKEYALPIVSFFGYQNKHRGFINIKLINRWERIIEAVDKKEKKKPGNSIDSLEQFITKGIDEIVKNKCGKEIPKKVLTAYSGDYFIQQKNKIRKKLHQRCQEIAFEKDFKVY